jgi:hypothetical protein
VLEREGSRATFRQTFCITRCERVVLVNQTLARTVWPGQDPIGQVLLSNGPSRHIIQA